VKLGQDCGNPAQRFVCRPVRQPHIIGADQHDGDARLDAVEFAMLHPPQKVAGAITLEP
jgi:hypothetical protein